MDVFWYKQLQKDMQTYQLDETVRYVWLSYNTKIWWLEWLEKANFLLLNQSNNIHNGTINIELSDLLDDQAIYILDED